MNWRSDTPNENELTNEHFIRNEKQYDYLLALAVVGIKDCDGKFFRKHYKIVEWRKKKGYKLHSACAGANEHGVEYEIEKWTEIAELKDD